MWSLTDILEDTPCCRRFRYKGIHYSGLSHFSPDILQNIMDWEGGGIFLGIFKDIGWSTENISIDSL